MFRCRHGKRPFTSPSSPLVLTKPRQIRVHLSHEHHPVLGDELYGLNDWNARARRAPLRVERPLLHAAELVIPPMLGRVKPLCLRATPPPDFTRVAEMIGASGVSDLSMLLATKASVTAAEPGSDTEFELRSSAGAVSAHKPVAEDETSPLLHGIAPLTDGPGIFDANDEVDWYD